MPTLCFSRYGKCQSSNIMVMWLKKSPFMYLMGIRRSHDDTEKIEEEGAGWGLFSAIDITNQQK
jgi:hypothetical protein